MRTYTLKARRDFTDKYDNSVKYKENQEITVDEERAFELLSSDYSLVKYVSHTDDNKDLEEVENIKKESEKIKAENDTVKAENETIKAENEGLKTENEGLKTENEGLKTENETIKAENEGLKTENETLKKDIEASKLKSQDPDKNNKSK